MTAAPPTSPFHVVTKGYIDSIFAALKISIPTLPSLPMPPLPPGITMPPGMTLPLEAEKQSAPQAEASFDLAQRLEAIEARLTAIEQALRIA